MAKLDKKQLQKIRADLKTDARQRVAERGVLQFRANAETVLSILDEAEKQQMPVGALLRKWVEERLVVEGVKKKAPDLVERVSLLEQQIVDIRQQLNRSKR